MRDRRISALEELLLSIYGVMWDGNIAPLFLNSALYQVYSSALHSGYFTPWKNLRCVVSRAHVEVWESCTIYTALLCVSGMLMTHSVCAETLYSWSLVISSKKDNASGLREHSPTQHSSYYHVSLLENVCLYAQSGRQNIRTQQGVPFHSKNNEAPAKKHKLPSPDQLSKRICDSDSNEYRAPDSSSEGTGD